MSKPINEIQDPRDDDGWDHASHRSFYEDYAEKSLTPETRERFESVQRMVLRIIGDSGSRHPLQVADIGCGGGTQCIIWAEAGHHVHGLDVNQPLIELGRERTSELGLDIELLIGSATELPWSAGSMDVCLVPELLEHVVDWEKCLNEFSRILKPDGLLYIATNNALCPVQNEFNLPLYSWYPRPLKRRYERLSVTTRPELANYAKYPAVNWFTPYQLKRELKQRDMQAFDRFDVMDLADKNLTTTYVIKAIRLFPPLRWLANVATVSSIVVGIRK